jgi:hypothetical protein
VRLPAAGVEPTEQESGMAREQRENGAVLDYDQRVIRVTPSAPVEHATKHARLSS